MTSDVRSGPLRILHIIDGLGVGGAEMQLALLLRHLPPERFAHVVCHIGPPTDLAGTIRGQGIPVHDLSLGGRRSLMNALASLVRQTWTYRPGVIHTDGVYSNLCGRLTGGLRGVPVLTTIGTTITLGRSRQFVFKPEVLRRRALWRAERLSGRVLGRAFIAVSGAVRESVISEYGVPADRIAVIHRGVDLERLMPASPDNLIRLRREIAPPKASPLLLNVGRLVRQKGQEYLIRALPAIRKNFPSVCLLLAGDGPLVGHYRAVALECGVADAVRFLGRRMDIGALLYCSDIFVFPSTREGAAGALLEAMAAGRPIVASDIPAIEEAAGGAAVLIPPRSPDHLASAITRMASHPEEWAAMGVRARHIVEERHDIKRNAEVFGRLCEWVAAGNRGAPRSPAVLASSDGCGS